jgi:peptidoglycan hydrolase-like protein with peptidoglycan-binding domain
MPSLDHTLDLHCTVILFGHPLTSLWGVGQSICPRPPELPNGKYPPRKPPADGINEFASFAAQLAARQKTRVDGGASAAPPQSVDRDDGEEATSRSLRSLLASHSGSIAAGALLLVAVSAAAWLVWGLPFQASTPLPSHSIEQAKADIAAAGKREVTVLPSVPPPPAAPSPPAASPLPAAPPPTVKEPPKSTPELPQSASQIPSTAEPRSAPLTPDEIRELQGKLKAAGLYTGAVDGVVGSQTRSALRDYAQARSLSSADATRELFLRLKAEPPAAVVSVPASPPGPPPPAAPQGDKPTPDGATALTPDEIRTLQDRLRAIGYYTGPTDGVMGFQTRSALRDYAQAQSLPSADVTRNLLARPRAEPPAAVAAAPAARPPVAQQGDKPTPAGPPALTPDDIRSLQDRLQAVGYYTGTIDGVMGSQTRSAVREYAKMQGVSDEQVTRDLLTR